VRRHLVAANTGAIAGAYDAIIGWGLLLGCAALAVARPMIAYDSWMYHLPFSAYLFGIGGGAASFHLDPLGADRWIGFPKAWEWLEGLAWSFAGSLHAAVLPQLMLCLTYFLGVARTWAVPAHWLVLGFFASPLLALHFQALLVDLPTGLAASLGFFLLLDIVTDSITPERHFSWWRAAGAVMALGLAGNIKYQGVLAVGAISMTVAVVAVTVRGVRWRAFGRLAAVLALANTLAAGTMIANLARHGDPFYPIAVKAFGATVFAGPEDPETDASYPTYLLTGSREIRLPGPIDFLLSVTELDWTLRGVAPWYNVDMVTGRSPRRGAPSRTGGLGILFVFFNGVVLATQLVRLRAETEPRQRNLVLAAALLAVVTACLPRSHELRYWLYLPLILLPINLRYLHRSSLGRATPVVLVALMAVGMAQAVLSPKSAMLTPHPVSMAALRAAVPDPVARALRETGRFCDPDDQTVFRFSEAVTGLAGLVSMRAEDCR
jgi:hypothetical protein